MSRDRWPVPFLLLASLVLGFNQAPAFAQRCVMPMAQRMMSGQMFQMPASNENLTSKEIPQ
jgi:hypothetical protein